MRFGPMRASDVPTAPAFVETGAIVGNERASVRLARLGVRDRMHRTHQDSRDAHGGRALVASQAIVATRKLRTIGLLGLDAVKTRALLGIDCRQLQHLAVLYEAHRRIVVEINRARRARRDMR